MSYARWGWDGSYVYIFENSGGFLECCACHLNEPNKEWEEGDPILPSSFTTTDLEEMVQHLHAHRDAGHTVPDYVESNLRVDFPNGYTP